MVFKMGLKRNQFSKVPEQFKVLKTSPGDIKQSRKKKNSDVISLVSDDQSKFEQTSEQLKKKTQKVGSKLNPGVVYLGHIPHGFFEQEMRKFFSQFGKVSRLRLARSRKTGNSRGYAFIEFECDEVAKVVAETMNNYLMFEKILQCAVIPPEKVHPFMFRGWKKGKFLASDINRFRQNRPRSIEKTRENLRKKLSKVNKIKEKLGTLGLKFNFKMEIPKDLELKKNKSESRSSESTPELFSKVKKNKKGAVQMPSPLSTNPKDVLHVISRTYKKNDKPKGYKKSGNVEVIDLEEPSSIKKEKKLILPNFITRKNVSMSPLVQKSEILRVKPHLKESKSDSPVYIMEIDSSDDEISLKTPPNSIKISKKSKSRLLKKKSKSPKAT